MEHRTVMSRYKLCINFPVYFYHANSDSNRSQSRNWAVEDVEGETTKRHVIERKNLQKNNPDIIFQDGWE